VPRHQRGADLIQGAVTNWALPTDTDYSLVNVTRGRAIRPDAPLSADLVSDRDELEIQPVLVAGGGRERR
jgi:hypothetical protein